MNSKEKLTKENTAEYQCKYIQRENYVATLNSADIFGTPVYMENVPQLLYGNKPLENAQKPFGVSNSNIQPSNSTSVACQIVRVPREERKYLNQFSEAGKQVKFFLDIMHRTGANLQEFTFFKGQGLDITVTGKPESVKEAKREIFARFQERVSAIVCTPEKQLYSVTGKTGGKPQDLEQKTAANIQTLCCDNSQNQIKIAGTKEGVKKDSHEAFHRSAEQDKYATERIHIAKLLQPFVARPYNRCFDKVIQGKEAQTTIPLPGTSHTKVMFTRKKKQLKRCVAPVDEILEDTKKKTAATAVEMKLQHKCTTKPKNNSVQETLGRTELSVETSPLARMSDREKLLGKPEKSRKAFTKVYSKVKDYTVSLVSAPSWIHKFIIGKKGHNICRITQNMPNVCVEFTGDDKITIEGPTEDVNYIQGKIEVEVKALTDRMNYEEINIDFKFHRYLKVKKSVNVNQIQAKNKVCVLISPANEKRNFIRIEGDSQRVQQAKKELLELTADVQNMQSIDLIIEQRYHITIVGQNGEHIRAIRKKFPGVMIIIPYPSQKSDIVQLMGPKNELEKCIKYLENVVADFVENNYSLTISILKHFHKHIIGKAGENIKKICAASNTKIHIPSESSSSENIVITGKQENCEAAYNWILSIVKDISNIPEIEISIPSSLYKALIDPQNCLIHSIMEECGGISIHFPKIKSGLQMVVIKGPARRTEKAKKKLLQLAKEKESNSYSVVLEVKAQYHKFFMSKNSSFSKICQNTGAHVVFTSLEDGNQELLTLTGSEEAVKRAQKELETLIKSLDDVAEDSILINPKCHRQFIMRKGQIFRQITEECGGVIINFSHSGKQKNKVTIKGAKPCVEAAKKQIQEIIDTFHSGVKTE